MANKNAFEGIAKGPDVYLGAPAPKKKSFSPPAAPLGGSHKPAPITPVKQDREKIQQLRKTVFEVRDKAI